MYGLAIQAQVMQDANGFAYIGHPTLYKSLTSLQSQGLIEVEEAGSRRPVYKLTERGQRKLIKETRRLDTAVQLVKRRLPY
jgi:DNA-binding PadR family transcriptional regulator